MVLYVGRRRDARRAPVDRRLVSRRPAAQRFRPRAHDAERGRAGADRGQRDFRQGKKRGEKGRLRAFLLFSLPFPALAPSPAHARTHPHPPGLVRDDRRALQTGQPAGRICDGGAAARARGVLRARLGQAFARPFGEWVAGGLRSMLRRRASTCAAGRSGAEIEQGRQTSPPPLPPPARRRAHEPPAGRHRARPGPHGAHHLPQRDPGGQCADDRQTAGKSCAASRVWGFLSPHAPASWCYPTNHASHPLRVRKNALHRTATSAP